MWSLLMAATASSVTPAVWAGLAFQQIYEFPTSAPGPWQPASRLVEGPDGSFCGTTSRGGLSDLGTVFKVTTAGVFTNLLSFTGANGQRPSGGLVLGKDGNFYGTAAGDGVADLGTAFRMNSAGVLNTLFWVLAPTPS